jgi:molybdate transport repressor ModE-like protein
MSISGYDLPLNILDRLRIRHLRLLEIVDREGSLGAAARELNVSQPAVTLLLRDLENVFATALVERDARGARLTPQGRRALERLVIVMAMLGQAVEDARAPATVPDVRIGCVQLAGFTAMPGAFARLLAQDSLPYARVHEGDSRGLLLSLAAGELDCAVAWLDESAAAAVDLDRFHIEPLWSSRMQVYAAASHPLARKRQVSLCELGQWPWVVPDVSSRTYAAFQRLFMNDGLAAPRARLVCSSIHSGAFIVAGGTFLGIAPDTLVSSYRHPLALKALRGDALALPPLRLSFFTLRDTAQFAPIAQLRDALLAVSGESGL